MNKKGLTIEEIKQILPHRHPFLFVDRVVDINDEMAVGIKNVTGNESFFEGHFPERPVMPGVLIIEALAQVGGIMMLTKNENRGKIAYFASINSARFRRVVIPGDQLRLEIKLVKLKSRVGLVTGKALVDGEVACEAEMMFSMAE